MADLLMFIILFCLIMLGLWAFLDFCFSIKSFIRGGCGKSAYYVPSSSKAKEDMLNEARRILKSTSRPMKVVDLGSGTGSLLLPLAYEFPTHRFVGYEWDPILIKISRYKAKNLQNIIFEQKNYMLENLSSFDLFLCFVLKSQGESVGLKLSNEMKSSAICISEKFELQHLKEIKRIFSRTWLQPFKIFIYTKK
ncbi:MAG: methyltransferase domain-containing protein [Alphaproteobacteria bacterium]|nr:methyltransferase domain-containing protein [Alphaproteobacteria bacterium]